MRSYQCIHTHVLAPIFILNFELDHYLQYCITLVVKGSSARSLFGDYSAVVLRAGLRFGPLEVLPRVCRRKIT